MIILHTNHGAIKIELDFDKAPISAANFQAYAEQGFFAGTLFHRVIPGFMIQGGGLLPNLDRKDSERAPIKNEADNGLKNRRGTLAMARTSDPHSASSQFFINLVDNGFLDYKSSTVQGYGYCVFGQVVEGMEVVDAIAKQPTGNRNGHGDVPKTDVLIESVEVVA